MAKIGFTTMALQHSFKMPLSKLRGILHRLCRLVKKRGTVAGLDQRRGKWQKQKSLIRKR